MVWFEKKIQLPHLGCFKYPPSLPKIRLPTFRYFGQFEYSFGFSHDPGSQPGQAKPYQTKPRHFRPIYRPFWPIFGAKVPKTHRKGCQRVHPLKKNICRIHFPLVPVLGKFIKFSNASDYMCATFSPERLNCLWWYNKTRIRTVGRREPKN